MTENLRLAGARVANGAGGSTSFMRNEIVGDHLRQWGSLENISRVLGNLGPADAATNYLAQQNNLHRAQA